MSVGSLMLGLALLLLVGLYVGRPVLLVEKPRQKRTAARWRLLAQKDALLAQISSLDFDYETGKMPEGAYQEQRAELMSQATGVLKKLDRLEEVASAGPRQGELASALGADIESVVARLRRLPPAETPLEETLQGWAGNGRGGFCPACGQPVDAGDKFCAHCGRGLQRSHST